MTRVDEIDRIKQELLQARKFIEWLVDNITDEDLIWQGFRRINTIVTHCETRIKEIDQSLDEELQP